MDFALYFLSFASMLTVLVLGSWSCLYSWRRDGSLISIFSLFFVFSTIDIFLPALFAIVANRMPEKPYWIPHFDSAQIALGGAVGALSFLLMWGGFLWAGRLRLRAPARGAQTAYRPNARRLKISLALLYGIFLLSQMDIISRFGGPLDYLAAMVKLRRSVFEFDSSGLQRLVNLTSSFSRDLILMLTAILLTQRFRLKSNFLILLLVVAGLLVSMTTFYRGSVLVYLLMLAAAEQYTHRNRVLQVAPDDAHSGRRHFRTMVRRPLKFALIAAGGFTLVGAVRSVLGAREWGELQLSAAQALAREGERFVDGAGLYSLVNIITHYTTTQAFHGGETIINQLLRFVPRVLWLAKPENYGASQINAELGVPLSTLEAVTIPGEFFANFGYPGLLGVVVFGLLAGFLEKRRYSGRAQYFYFTAGVSVVISVGWFSVTGFMSWLGQAVVLWIALKFVVQPVPGDVKLVIEQN